MNGKHITGFPSKMDASKIHRDFDANSKLNYRDATSEMVNKHTICVNDTGGKE
jgi:hypothetical protein